MDSLRVFIFLCLIKTCCLSVRSSKHHAVDKYQLPVDQEGQFTSFKDRMSGMMKVDSKMMALPEVREWYDKEYVRTGKHVDFTNPRETSRIITVLSSMFCTNCWNQRDCACLRRLGCFRQC